MHTFDNMTLKKATEIVISRFTKETQINIGLLNGDHWQDGDLWTGPRPGVNDPLMGIKMAAIQNAYVSRNVVSETVDRHTAGVLGRELHWGFTVTRPMEPVEALDPISGETITEDGTPNDDEVALIREAELLLVEWWDKREIPEILQNMLDGALCAKRSPLRLYVPPGLRDEQGNLPGAPIDECLNYIWLQHLGTDEDTLNQKVPSATVYMDKNTKRDVGIFVYEHEKAEGEEGKAEQQGELSYLDDDGFTVLRMVSNDGNILDPFKMPLGGRLTIYEMTRKWMVTPQVVSQQKSLNKTLTMQDRNNDLAGFLERTYLNVKWPTTTDPVTGKEVPAAMYTGPGAMNILQGSEWTDDQGNMHVANPSVVYRDPVSPDTFITSANAIYLAMLSETQQLHYASAGDAIVTGESRKQAREAFKTALQISGGKVESAVRWILETTLAMASFFAGQPNRFEGLRAYAQTRLDLGPLSADDMRVAAEMWERGVWKLETAQSATGIEDVDAENEGIEREQAKRNLRDTNMAKAALAEAERRFDQEGLGADQEAQPIEGAVTA